MPNQLRIARSRLANATRVGDPKLIADARADFHREKVIASIHEHAPNLRQEDWVLIHQAVLASLVVL